MTDSINTRVDRPSGPLHAGTGNIYNIHGDFRPGTAARPAFRRIADDQLRWLRRVLVPPVNMGQARSLLADTGTVIVDGPPGSGRSCAARVLLREYRHDSGVLHELQPEEDDELPLRDPDLVGTGDQLLLDLSGADDSRWSRACGDLPALRKSVHDRRAHLVVVMPHRSRLEADLQHYRVVFSPPRALDVLRRHLREHGLPYEDYMRPDDTITGFLRDRPMREIAAFADLVRRAREAAPDQGFADWCTAAGTARNDRRTEVAKHVSSLHGAPPRVLALTVAMLHGAHADVIHHADQILLRTIGSAPEQLSLLEHKDLAERFDEIQAVSDARGHVTFTQLDYDAAVRTHFWDHVPDLRPHLGAWVAQLLDLKDPNMTADVRRDVVARLAAQYLRTEHGDRLAFLAKGWCSASASQSSRDAAVEVLACGLNDPGQGARLRNLVRYWCAELQLKGEFADVLTRVCAEVIAASHPDQALIRLHHLARRAHDTSRALDALHELVASSRRLRRRLLDRLARSDPAQAELAIFLATCEPQPLTESGDAPRALVREDGVRRSLTVCWQRVLTTLPRPQWQPQVESWLHAAAYDAEGGGDLLLDLLVEAACRCESRSGAVFAALYASARDAERSAQGDPQRSAATTRLLLTKIRTAQGLGPTDPTTAPARGTRQ